MHKFKITIDAVGHGSVEMDGRPVSVRAVTVEAGVDRLTVVTLQVPASSVELAAETDEAFVDVTKIGEGVRRVVKAAGK